MLPRPARLNDPEPQYGALLATQYLLVMSIRNEDGRVKRTFVKAYFYFFAATLSAVVLEHMYVIRCEV